MKCFEYGPRCFQASAMSDNSPLRKQSVQAIYKWWLLVEHSAPKPWIEGSNPGPGTWSEKMAWDDLYQRVQQVITKWTICSFPFIRLYKDEVIIDLYNLYIF